tara:strand:- start:74151 stop:74660 length:510 start_codon:yes stop_codon:yes gene_type:complete
MQEGIIKVFAAYGDYHQVGGGSLLGVFREESSANDAVKGRGSLDCGGDGNVEERSAMILSNGKINLLDLDFFIELDKVVTPNPRYVSVEFDIKIKDIKKPIDFMVVYRRKTGCLLKEAKDFADKVRENGEASLSENQNNFSALYEKEDVVSWKEELELNDIATVEAVEL